MRILSGSGHVYEEEIPVSDDEYQKAVNGTINSLIRVGSQGITGNNAKIVKDENNKREIVITNNYVTQFHGLSGTDAESQGFSSIGDLQSYIEDTHGGTVGDSQAITVIFFQLS